MTKKEFYKTIEVTPINLVSSYSPGDKFEKYDSWELLLSSYVIGRHLYGRIKADPKALGKDLIKLGFLQNEIDKVVEEMYAAFLK